ncbi:hypothetical protein AAHA92_15224 [Salvia divinorum]|uniref:Uncharacterized protein n=1 Tax=Salvia divinorum TaxID=28513 RepID=A0ABD1HEI9_SALDI
MESVAKNYTLVQGSPPSLSSSVIVSLDSLSLSLPIESCDKPNKSQTCKRQSISELCGLAIRELTDQSI